MAAAVMMVLVDLFMGYWDLGSVVYSLRAPGIVPDYVD